MRTASWSVSLPLLAFAVVCLLFGNEARADFIINGGFEQPGGLTSDVDYLAGDTSIVGWTIVSGSVDIVPSTGSWPAYQGNQSLDLDGHSAGTISQTFDTTAGMTYQLSFAYANNPGGGAAAAGDDPGNPVRTATVSVLDDGGSTLLSQDIGHEGSTAADMNWTIFTGSFTAHSATTTLVFTSTDPATSYGGIALDAVSVQAVPEPPGLALVGAGLATLAGYAGWRRRNPANGPNRSLPTVEIRPSK